MKRILKKAFKKIRRFVSKPFRYLAGKKFLDSVLKIKKDNEIYVFISGLIGDFVIGLTCIEDFIAFHQGKKIVLIYDKDLFSWYPYLKDKCLFVKCSELYEKYGLSPDGRVDFLQSSRLSEKGLRYGVINSIPCFFKKTFKKENASGIEQVREYIFKLPKVGKISSPIVLKPASAKYELTKKDVIINPYSNSVKKDINVYQTISNLCLKAGLNVYSNVLSSQKELRGTKRLECSLDELFYLSQNARVVISVRSGVLDFLSFSGCNIIAVFDDPERNFYKCYNMKQFQKSYIQECLIKKSANNKEKESRLKEALCSSNFFSKEETDLMLK